MRPSAASFSSRLSARCAAFASDAAEDFPRRPAPVPKKEQDWTILLVRRGGGLLVRRRPRGLLGGLYEFVAVEGHPGAAELPGILAARGFSHARILERLPDAKHVFTHLVWRMRGWRAVCAAYPPDYAPADDLDALTFPSALRTYRTAAHAAQN